MIAEAVAAYLHLHHLVYAAPLECKSYGGLSPIQSIELAVEEMVPLMGPFGFSLQRSRASLDGGTVGAVWTGCDIVLSLTEAYDARWCYVGVSSKRPYEVERFGAVLRRFLPLVELGREARASAQAAQLAQIAT